MWCEIGSFVRWRADPAALGEADTRARAIDAGWRIDALGRLDCPQCQQGDPGFLGFPPGRNAGSGHGPRQDRADSRRGRRRRRPQCRGARQP